MPAKFTGTAAETFAYSESLGNELLALHVSGADTRQLISKTRSLIAETRAAMAWLAAPENSN
jgi:hypothetical protein